MGHESLIQRRPSLSHPGWLRYFFSDIQSVTLNYHTPRLMLLMIFDHLLVIWLSRPKRIAVEQLAFSDEASLQCLCPGLFPWNPAIRNLTKEKGTRWEKHGAQKELKVKNFRNIWRPSLIFMLKLSSMAKQLCQVHEFLMDDTEESINIQTKNTSHSPWCKSVDLQNFDADIFSRKVSVYRVVLFEVMNFVANVNAAMQICIPHKTMICSAVKRKWFQCGGHLSHDWLWHEILLQSKVVINDKHNSRNYSQWFSG